MFPYRRMPCHITVLYVFTVVNLVVLCHVTMVDADVIVKDPVNNTEAIYRDKAAQFGRQLPTIGLQGCMVYVEPRNGCSVITPPPTNFSTNKPWIAIIMRGDCDFDKKVIHAQLAGYGAAIVYNDRSDELLPMYSYDASSVIIPSVFVGETDGLYLIKNYQYWTKYYLTLTPDFPVDFDSYLLPFAVVVGICFIIMLIFMLAKCVRDQRRKRRSRLSIQHLKRIPVKKYKKGDDYDVCAICLEDYDEGDKLRLLPCSHAYHTKCIDPWLTNNKKTCPICKRQVIPGNDTDSSDSDAEDGEAENTPLLSATHTVGSSTFYTDENPFASQSPTRSTGSTESADSSRSTDTAGPLEFAPTTSVMTEPYLYSTGMVTHGTDALSVTSEASSDYGNMAGHSSEQLVTVNVYPPPINNTEQRNSSCDSSSDPAEHA
ncbi:PREDICTED: E3 ubiquitin-protein ligase RNF13-like isoform X2 [Priapulus caudatus]|uniref:RING-type E3 ubiquitin transferase n=1 Tax=Priapulus caudatus TaxID=37621 RepID=A0ABM1DUM2_PRICU|nr:PREDICTED: E3 ubiquitin-protein ligase RNF13-like isoform X2 [Priapulus caudatus]